MKLFILDVGGVLCENTDVAPAIASFLDLTEAQFRALAALNGHDALLSGSLTEGAFWGRFSRRIGRPIPADLWSVFFDPRMSDAVASVIRGLRATARVVAGTNTFESHYRVLRSRGCYDAFDTVYASHRMGTAKPAATFYRYILEREGCSPSDAFFVDDTEENVVAARGVGLDGHAYRGAAGLRTELERLRVFRRGERGAA